MSAPLKILILEDSDIDALVIQHLLNRSNLQCQFHLAMDEGEFIDALNNFKPHVILSDNSLPQFNAMEALQIVQRHLLHIPFILVTGFVSEEYAANIIKLGADDYLLKDRLSRLPVAINAALKQKEIEKEKWKVEKDNQLKAGLLNTIGQAVMATDIKGIIQYWNKAAEKIYGWSVEEAMGKNAAELIPAQQTAEAAMEIAALLNTGQFWQGELEVWGKDKILFPVYATHSPIYDGEQNLSGIIGISSDNTERKKNERELKSLNEQLHGLYAQLQNVREEERLQIARDIHDELGQQLTGLKMEISWLMKKLVVQDNGLQQKAAGVIGLVDEAIKSVRRISGNLRPGMLDDLGLIATLEWHNEEVEKRAGIKINFTPIAEPALPLATSTALFRIYQEALTNVVRHANATQVTASLQVDGNSLVLIVKDDGLGMDLSKKNNNKTLGLVGIKERTFILDGQCEIDSAIGKGTSIKITIPL